jgi:hypothetical protein
MSPSTELLHPAFSDEDIRAIVEGGSPEIAAWARSTASERGITVTLGVLDDFVKAVTRLSDGAELDPVEELLVALSKAGLITSHQRGLLQLHYLR